MRDSEIEWQDEGILEAASAPQRAHVLREAERLTCGDRHAAYGCPVENHVHIAAIFNAITGRDLSAREIALVQTATKLARRAKNPLHRDSYIDAAAYAAIEFECALAEGDPPLPPIGSSPRRHPAGGNSHPG